MEILNELVWNFVFVDHLDLFRISDFEFQVFYLLLIPWRLCLFAGVLSFPISNFCCSLVSGKLSDNETLCQPELAWSALPPRPNPKLNLPGPHFYIEVVSELR